MNPLMEIADEMAQLMAAMVAAAAKMKSPSDQADALIGTSVELMHRAAVLVGDNEALAVFYAAWRATHDHR